ncbi:MAG: hypothetical protein ACI9V1_002128 [Spirosomataceae bacterium]|jgi:hypothetical protein
MGLHNELPVYKASYDLLIEIFEGLVGNARRYARPDIITVRSSVVQLSVRATVENSPTTPNVREGLARYARRYNLTSHCT